MRQKIAAIGIFLLGVCLLSEGGSPTTTTGPNFRLVLSPKQLTSYTGFALIGEVGDRMARVNATLGYQIGACQRLKLSVDQLSQKLDYSFLNRKKGAWVQQIAAGASYKYFLDECWFDSIDAGGWYSNAPNKKLSSVTLTEGMTTRTFEQRVAGSNAWHGCLGTTILPWEGAAIGLSAVYDHVDYRKEILYEKAVSGFGFAVDYNQRLFNCIDFSVRGDFLRPYQHVGGTMSWTMPCSYGDFAVGVYGDYTQGRRGLPNDTSFGIQLNFAFGDGDCQSPYYNTYCVRDCTRPRQDLLEWITDPAVMVPMVLAVVDQCTPPLASVLPDVSVDIGFYAINTASAFLGGECRRVVYSAVGLPPGASINEDSGVITGTNLGVFTSPFTVTVKSESVCGFATSSFVLTMESL